MVTPKHIGTFEQFFFEEASMHLCLIIACVSHHITRRALNNTSVRNFIYQGA